jgi:hypothetical protein
VSSIAAVSLAAAAVICVPNAQTLLEDVNVVDVAHGTIQPHRDVLMAQGKIAAIANPGQISKSGIPVRVYAGGKFLIPGLWDSHVHIRSSEREIPLFLVFGVTSVRDVRGDDLEIKIWQHQGEAAPHLLTANITGTRSDLSNSFNCRQWEQNVPMLASLRHRLQLDAGETFASVGGVIGMLSNNDNVRAGRASDHSVALSPRESTQLYLRAERQLRERIANGDLPLAGSDAGGGDAVPGMDLHTELQLLVEAGLSPAAALRSATILPACALHISCQSQGIAVGQEATAVVLDFNPLQDIRNTRSVDAVILQGRYLSRAKLDEMLLNAMASARH